MNELDIISLDQADTLDSLFYERAHQTPDKVAYIQYHKLTEQWQQSTWSEMTDLIALWQTAMKQEKLKKGDRVALLLKNSKEWIVYDQAALGLGLVVVPLYLDDRPDNIAYILDDANVKLLCIQEQRLWGRLKEAFNESDNQINSLERIVLIDVHKANVQLDDERLVTLSDWLPEKSHLLSKRIGDRHDLATIVYTSGTTGRPKGVMLSHYNIMSVAHGTALQLKILPTERLLSFLPMSHTFERTLGYYLTVMTGSQVTFSQSTQQLANELLIHKPTILISVPRIFEQVYLKIKDQLKKSSWVKRFLFNFTVSIGWNVFLYKQQLDDKKFKGVCFSCMLWPLLKTVVADKVLQKFGGNLKIAATGGAAIPFPVAKTFLGLGMNLLQGYGLTETSPVVSFNRIENNQPKSIGLPLGCVQVKLGEQNELLIKSPGVMMGYWNNHSATAKVIDDQGWFHSGDQADINPETGNITITGRLKDILIMSNGEKIPPSDIENSMNIDEWFDQSLLVGEGEAFLSAILVFNPQAWTSVAESLGLDPFDKQNLTHKKVHSQVLSRLKQVLHDFPGYAKVRRVILTLDPWTVSNELMTPTLKIKRARVLDKFEQEVKTIYQ